MSFEYNAYILPLIIAAAISISTATYAWIRRSANGASALFLMSLAISIWAIGYALEIAGTTLETKYFWGVIEYLGIAFAPYAWLIFSYNFSNENNPLSKRWVSLIAVIPSITVILALTTKWNGLIWSEYHINQQAGFSALGVSHGTWFNIHFVYSYLLLAVGTALIINTLFRRQGLYRSQAAALIIAVLAPWIGNAIYLTGNSLLDLTPFAFTVTVVAIAWAILGFHLVDVAPIARDLIIDSMQDGMIVLNIRNSIVDINQAAARMIGVSISDALGKNAAEVFTPWPHLIERFRSVVEANEEITVGSGNAIRTYEVRFSPLKDRQENVAGRVIMLRRQNEALPSKQRFPKQDISPRTMPRQATQSADTSNSGTFGWLIDFFITPAKADLKIPLNMNPSWYQARERSFTIITRIAALLGTIAYILTLPLIRGTAVTAVNLTYGAIVLVLWILGLLRSASFQNRAVLFLSLIFVLGFVETQNFGFSVESFIFFLTFIITAVLLTGRSGGWIAASISFFTLFFFNWFISKENFIPYNLNSTTIAPRNFEAGLTSLFVFTASALAISTSITILMESLNRAWKSESQASNLLQQERDLLEQRVDERTHALAEARDEAIKVNNELRKFFSAIEQSGNSVLIMDTEGKIEYVNPKYTETTGYEPSESLGKHPAVLMKKHDSPPSPESSDWWQVVSKGNIWHGVFHNRKKNGELVWESATIAPVFNMDGNISNYVEIKQDITEQKLLQDQLQSQNDYLSILHQMTLDLLNRRDLRDLLQAIVDRSAILLDAPYSELMLEEDGFLVVEAFTNNQPGISGDRVTRDQSKLSWHAFDTKQPIVLEEYSAWKGHREIYNPYNLQAVADFPVMAGDRCLGILALGRSEKGYTFTPEQVQSGLLFARLVALVLDNAQLYASAQNEIAERKRTEALLQESENRFRQIVENASDIIYRTDENGNFIYVNPTSLRIMGSKTEQDLLGKKYTEIASPEWKHKVQRFYEKQFLHQEERTYYEFQADTFAGETIWLGQNVQLIRQQGKIIGFQAVARDITQLKQAQEALAISRDQALDGSRLKSQLLSRVSHELRTPLGGILGYAELLQHKTFGELNPKQADAIEQIIQSSNYLTNIVSDLLDQAQIEAKSISLHNEYFSPAQFLQKVETSISTLAAKKGLIFSTSISPELPTELYGDKNRLQQILINLAGNAVKFTRQGSVDIQLNRPSPTQWTIEVTDTGAGIPTEEHENIFEPFRQVSNSITRENQGSGLGLAISKQLIELMNGQISLQSELNKGSKFIVTLPIINAPGE
ncbi:MAG: histidine kinase N-terminal 7TM domain-containing protein [Anaerolineales bacterium]